MAKRKTSPPEQAGGFTGLPAGAGRFLRALANNNNREWYHANKKAYHEAHEAFAAMLEALSDTPAARRAGVRGGPETMFRIFRDTRFSPDKTPYKTSLSGLLTPSGTKEEHAGVFYAQFGVDESFVGTGYWRPETAALNLLRTRMTERAAEWQKVIDKIEAHGHAFDPGDALKRMPRGFEKHADHRHAPWLRKKSLIIRIDVPAKRWGQAAILDHLAELLDQTAPLLAFGQKALRKLRG